ncbi:hypothetical protein GCM10025787_23680 [Saccharopolyspora rosea]|uniref:PPE domain-containing protein n=1 Tax=Saccharopolyspora rosea TaxID=524884 RepID=A0ABW3FM04_9PSEU
MGLGDWLSDKADSAWRTVHDTGAGVFGYDTYAQQEAKQHAEQAAKTGARERDALAERNRALRDGVEGYDPPGISQCVNWSSFSHQQIYDTNQKSIDEGKATQAAHAWQKLGKALRDHGSDYASGLKNIIGGGWEGEAAEQAKTVGDPIKSWTENTGNAFEMTGNNLATVASAAGQVKAAVSKPEGYSWGRSVVAGIASGPVPGLAGRDAVAQMREHQEAETQAQETMGRVYSPTFTDVDSKMPQFRKPDGTTVEPPPPPPPDHTPWGGGPVDPGGRSPGGGPDGGGPGGGGHRDGAGPGHSGPGGGDRSGGGDHRSPGSVPPDVPGGGRKPSGTDIEWADPVAPGMPPGGGAGTGPGGVGGGGAGPGVVGIGGGATGGGSGVGGGGRAGGGTGRGAGSSSGVGAGGRAGAGSSGGAGAGAGAAGRSGSGARGGMLGAGAGRGAKGGEDEDHERPTWLEEQDDVWFNDMPRTAPPVLGE